MKPFANCSARALSSTGTWGGFKDTQKQKIEYILPVFNPADHFDHVVAINTEESIPFVNLTFVPHMDLQSKSVRRIIKWSTRNDFIFSRKTDVGIEGYLYNIKFSDVPGIVAKFCRYYELDKNNVGKEFCRQANYIKAILIPKLSLEDCDLLAIKDFLLNYSACGSLEISNNLEPYDSIFVRHPRLKLDKPSAKLFALQVKSKRESNMLPPVVERSTDYNFLKTIVVDGGRNTYDMDPIKVRKVINSMIKLNKSFDNVKSWLNERCFSFKTKDDLKEPRFLWFRKYLNHEYLTYKINDDDRFLNSLKAHLKTLKDKLVDFAKSQFAYSVMTYAEKQEFKAQRRLDFNKILFSPSIQKLYLEGYTHQDVLDFIYLDKCGIVYTQDVLGKYEVSKSLSKRDRKIKLSEKRDGKFRVESKNGAEAYFEDAPTNFDFNTVYGDTASTGSSQTYSTGFFPGEGLEQKYLAELFRKGVGKIDFIKYLVKTWNFSFGGIVFVLRAIHFLVAIGVSCVYALIAFIVLNWAIISERLLFCWNCFKDAVNTTESVRSGALKTRKVVLDAHTYFTNPDAVLDPSTKVILIEVKSLAHTLYHLCNKNYGSAAEWMSNFLCTRPDEIKQFIANFPGLARVKPPGVRHPQSEAHIQFLYRGCFFNIPVTRYEEFARTFDAVDPDDENQRLYLLEMFNERFVVEALPGFEDMSSYIGVLTSWFDKYSIPTLHKHDMKNLNAYFMLYSNMKRAGSDAISLSKFLFSFICRSFFAWDPNDPAFSQLVISMLTVIKLTDELITTQNMLPSRRDLIDKTIALYYEATEINQKAVFQQVPNFLQRLYYKRFGDLENMVKLAIGYRCGIKERKEPLCILFTGPPSVGKSGTCKFLQKSLCFMDDTVWDPVMTYTFSNTDQFWEGYAQQKFVVMDDMFQTTDMQLRGHQATSLIHMVNTAPFNLPMAFDAKGQAFFNSEYILGSTNMCNHGFKNTTFNEVGLQDPEALKRRFGLVLHRDAKIQGRVDIATLKWRVDKCVIFPEYEGQLLSSAQITKLAKKIKCESDGFLSNQDYPPDELSKVLAQCELDNIKDMVRVETVDNESVVSAISFDGLIHDDTVRIKPESKTILQEDTSLLIKSGWSRHTLERLKTQFSDWFDKAHVFFEEDYYKHVFGYLYENVTDSNKRMEDITLIITALSALGLVIGGVAYLRSSETKVEEEKPTVATETFEKSGAVKLNERGRIIKNPDVVNGRKYINAPTIAYGNGVIVAVESKNNYMSCLHHTIFKGLIYFNGYAEVRGEMIIESCVGFHIKDGFVAVPAHFFFKFDDFPQAKLKISINKIAYEIPFPDGDVLRIPNVDMVLFKLPSTVPIPKELLKHFANAENAESIPEDRAVDILALSESGGLNIIHGSKSNPVEPIDYTSCDKSFSIRSPITYYASTQQGNSGALISVQLSSGQLELVGMHVGAYVKGSISNHGVAIPLCRQYLEELISYCVSTPKVIEPNVVEEEIKFVVNSKALDSFPLDIFRTLNSTEYSRVNRKSSYKKSKLFGWNGPSIKKPAHLKNVTVDGNVIDPLFLALTKFDQREREPSEIPEHTWDYLHNLYGDGGGRVLTWDEVLNGNSGYIRSICHGTSPGYPWNKVVSKGKGKSAFILNDGARFSFVPDFKDKLLEYEKQLLNGQQIEVYWADCLKDELRLNDKVDKIKTRVFSTSPLHYSLLIKKYYGEFAAHLKSKCITHPVSVGINPHSVEWTLIYNRLRDKGKSIIAGDSSKFDANVPSNLVLGINKFINKWYDDGPENQRVRDLLIQHIIEAYHVCQDSMYVIRNSNPSGNAITSELNSLVELLETYIVLTEDLKISSFDFDLVVYGDDNVIAVNREGLRVSDLAPHYKRRFNVDYTHFSKDEVDRDDTLETVEYLGRGFRPEGGLVRAPLKYDIVTQSTYWLHSKAEDVIYETMGAMFLELSHHGRDIFVSTTDKFLKYIKENRPDMYDAACNKRHTYYEYYSGMYEQDKFRDFWNGW